MKKIISVLLLIVFSLTGCLTVISTDSELKISSGEKWKFHMELTAPHEQVALYSSDLAQQFDDIAEDSKENGIDFSWKQGNVDSDGNVIFIIDVDGTGYDRWNEWIGSADSLQNDEFLGEPVLKFSLDMNYSAVGQGLTNNFTLEGGKILSTNGEKLSSNTAKWIDAGYMEAIMVPPRINLSLLIIIIGSFVVVILVISLLFLSKSKKTINQHSLNYHSDQPNMTKTPDPFRQENYAPITNNNREEYQNNDSQDNIEVRFCGSCGEPWTLGGKFCTKCGRPWENQT